jgi:hypothetical protein
MVRAFLVALALLGATSSAMATAVEDLKRLQGGGGIRTHEDRGLLSSRVLHGNC